MPRNRRHPIARCDPEINRFTSAEQVYDYRPRDALRCGQRAFHRRACSGHRFGSGMNAESETHRHRAPGADRSREPSRCRDDSSSEYSYPSKTRTTFWRENQSQSVAKPAAHRKRWPLAQRLAIHREGTSPRRKRSRCDDGFTRKRETRVGRDRLRVRFGFVPGGAPQVLVSTRTGGASKVA